jgi:hypothetical protein
VNYDTDVPVDDPLPTAVPPQCPGIEHRVIECDVDEWLSEALSVACAPTQSISLPSTPVCLRMCAFWLHPSGVCVYQCHEICVVCVWLEVIYSEWCELCIETIVLDDHKNLKL